MKIILAIISIITIPLCAFCQHTAESVRVVIKSSVPQPYLNYTDQFGDLYDLEYKQTYNLTSSSKWLELVNTSSKKKAIYWLRARENYRIAKKGDGITITSTNRQAQTEANFFTELEQICPSGNCTLTDLMREHKRAKNPVYRDSVRSVRLSKGLNLLDLHHKSQQVSDEFYMLCKSYLNITYYTYPSPIVKVLSQNDRADLQQAQTDELLFTTLYRNYIGIIACKDSLKKQSREFVNFSLVKQSFDKKEKSFTEIANNYLKESTNLEYSEYVKKLAIQTSNTSDGMLTDYYGKKVSLSSLIKASKGKIIYIDFWASWCSPCKAELPFSLALHKANPNVAFLYLSMDSNINAWKRAVTEQGLDPKRCYLIDKEKESTIAKQYKVKTIPHYLIFNKNGVIINSNAPRPSESKELSHIFNTIQ